MMTEREAWLHVAECLRERVESRHVSYSEFLGRWQSRGLCISVEWLFDTARISEETFDSMKQKINEERGRIDQDHGRAGRSLAYVWPPSDIDSRVAFCERAAGECPA